MFVGWFGLVGWWEVHLPSEIAKWSLCRIFNTKSRSLETEIYGHILRLWLREICYNVWITKYEWPFGWLADWLSNINTYIGLSPLIFPNSFEEKYDAHTHRHTHRPRLKQLTPCKCISQPSDPTDLNRICWLQQSEINYNVPCIVQAYRISSCLRLNGVCVCIWVCFSCIVSFFWFTHFLIILLRAYSLHTSSSTGNGYSLLFSENCIPIFIIEKKYQNFFNNKGWASLTRNVKYFSNWKCQLWSKLGE